MSIRIAPESERTGAVAQAEPVLLPSAGLPYVQRAARLRTLAQGHVMADYLLWAADVVDAQQAIAQATPLPEGEGRSLAQVLRAQTRTPLHSGHWQRSAQWLVLLDGLLQQLAQQPSMQSEAVQRTLSTLQQASAAQRNSWADALLAHLRGEETVPAGSVLPDAGVAQLLWSALSVYWRQLAGHLQAAGVADVGAERHLCPICAHAPTGSLILDGQQSGTRYVQCSLCESQWHVVRSQCTNCEGLADLDYWSLESEKAAIKAESCGDCHSYLKAFYVPVDPGLEMVADDLASLALDAEMEVQGLARSGVNPLMLPG